MTELELRQIASCRKIALGFYHTAVHEAQRREWEWLDGYRRGRCTALYLECKLLRGLHRWAQRRLEVEPVIKLADLEQFPVLHQMLGVLANALK